MEMPAVSNVTVKLPAGPKGDDGKDYVLTEADKTKIAEMAAELVDVPEPDVDVNLTGYATEKYVQEYAQPKGEYLTKVPEGYAKTSDIPKKPADIGAQPAGNYLTQHQDISGKLDADKLPEAVNTALAQAKASGEFNGKDGVSVTHSWIGTTLKITSASGMTSANLKGEKGDKGDPAPNIISSSEKLNAVVGNYYELLFDKMDHAGTKTANGSVVYAADGKVYLVTNVNASSTYCIAKCVADMKCDSGGASVAQSDWNANEGEPGHILNRPFYTEAGKGFVEVAPEATIETVDG